jgi:hypothetical protein
MRVQVSCGCSNRLFKALTLPDLLGNRGKFSAPKRVLLPDIEAVSIGLGELGVSCQSVHDGLRSRETLSDRVRAISRDDYHRFDEIRHPADNAVLNRTRAGGRLVRRVFSGWPGMASKNARHPALSSSTLFGRGEVFTAR